MNKKKIVAVIPARSGSKGILNKNMYDVNGRPLLWYTLQFAIKSKFFSSVFISTDSKDYEQYALDHCVESLGLRSEENSTDSSTTIDVIDEFLTKHDDAPDVIVLLQPTSPLRYKEDIINIEKMFHGLNEDVSIISAFKIDEPHPHKTFYIEDNHIKPLHSFKSMLKPRQSLDKCYGLDGAFYIFTPDFFWKHKSLIQPDSLAYNVDKKRVNIDSMEDLHRAKRLLREHYEY